MSKLIYIDTKDITLVLDTTVYEKKLPPTLSDRVTKTVKIPDDELERELRVTFKNGETVYITGNDTVAELESRLGVSTPGKKSIADIVADIVLEHIEIINWSMMSERLARRIIGKDKPVINKYMGKPLVINKHDEGLSLILYSNREVYKTFTITDNGEVIEL